MPTSGRPGDLAVHHARERQLEQRLGLPGSGDVRSETVHRQEEEISPFVFELTCVRTSCEPSGENE